MDDDWDDFGTKNQNTSGGGNGYKNGYADRDNDNEGLCFSKGRGYSIQDAYQSERRLGDRADGDNFDSSGWGGNDDYSSSRGGGGDNHGSNRRVYNYAPGRRDGGGDGERRGGGRRNYEDRNDNNGGFGDNEDDAWTGQGEFSSDGFRGRGGGRGGRGRGGGGGGFRGRGGGGRGGGDADGQGRGGEEGGKPPPSTYVPEETGDDELSSLGISSGVNFHKYQDIPVETSGENVPPPIKSFKTAGLRDLVLSNIEAAKYTALTPIQSHAIPIIAAGRDVMACAQTGSGKTAAFLVPIINGLLESKQDLVVAGDYVSPQCVIITPTRELTTQIYEHARKFAMRSVLKVCQAYGGTQVSYQRGRLLNGCHILVATPGRMLAFVRERLINFSATKFVVLDEADRMLDMGFLSDVETVMEHETMPPLTERQTLMFSATFPDEIQQCAGRFLNNYIFVRVGIVGGACSDIEQRFVEVEKFKKREALQDILREEGTAGTLVFVDTKRNADFLAILLCETQMNATSIHGDRLQYQREEALREFRSGVRDILVATEVAARGLDIRNVRHVINYDLPKSTDQYVHRIGRTGRVGNKGKATSFYDPTSDSAMASGLVHILKGANQPIPSFLESAGRGGGYFGGGSDDFGGTDIRNGFDQPTARDEQEEMW